MSRTERKISLTRTSRGEYTATNDRGGTLNLSANGTLDFTPVEALLAAVGACSSVDVDAVISRHTEPDSFEVTVRADKITTPNAASKLDNLELHYTIDVSTDDERETEKLNTLVARAAQISRDRDCTVSRTVEDPTQVTFFVNGAELD